MERDIEKRFREQIESMGGKCLKFISPGNAGVPDRIVIMPGGEVFFVELKTDKGKVKKLQEWFITELKELGCRAVIIRERKEADEFIQKLKGGDAG